MRNIDIVNLYERSQLEKESYVILKEKAVKVKSAIEAYGNKAINKKLSKVITDALDMETEHNYINTNEYSKIKEMTVRNDLSKKLTGNNSWTHPQWREFTFNLHNLEEKPNTLDVDKTLENLDSHIERFNKYILEYDVAMKDVEHVVNKFTELEKEMENLLRSQNTVVNEALRYASFLIR